MKEMPDVTHFFHPVFPARALKSAPRHVEIAGRKFALWCDAAGRPSAVNDACPQGGVLFDKVAAHRE